jgi:hypothetical protein
LSRHRGETGVSSANHALSDHASEEDPDSGALHKIIAGYHQFHAVNAAVQETVRASAMRAGDAVGEQLGTYWSAAMHGGKQGDRRAGVVWHTQGSSKSFAMLFYAARVVLQARRVARSHRRRGRVLRRAGRDSRCPAAPPTLGEHQQLRYTFLMARATPADRAHFERIAHAADALERARQADAAREDPAVKIEQALRLSNALLRDDPLPAVDAEPKRFSLAKRWRELRARGKHERDRT